ncbi:MAG: RNA polymerase sigma factor [Pseudobdellovibrio sp.]
MKNFLFGSQPKADKEEWLRSCLQKNESNLIRYVKSLVHNLETSKEIVQDSFLKLWEQDHDKLKGFETPWLFTTSRNSAYDFLRKKKRLVSGGDEIMSRVPDSSLNSEEKLLERNTQDALESLLKTLSPEHREIINLKFQHGFSYKEIAEVTGLSPNHVGVVLHGIVAKLKDKLKTLESNGGRYENR